MFPLNHSWLLPRSVLCHWFVLIPSTSPFNLTSDSICAMFQFSFVDYLFVYSFICFMFDFADWICVYLDSLLCIIWFRSRSGCFNLRLHCLSIHCLPFVLCSYVTLCSCDQLIWYVHVIIHVMFMWSTQLSCSYVMLYVLRSILGYVLIGLLCVLSFLLVSYYPFLMLQSCWVVHVCHC